MFGVACCPWGVEIRFEHVSPGYDGSKYSPVRVGTPGWISFTPAMVLGAIAVWAGFLLVSGAKQLRRRMKLCPGCVGVAPAPRPAPRVSALHRVTHPETELKAEP